jgi:Fe2+ transport system protein FeoA
MSKSDLPTRISEPERAELVLYLVAVKPGGVVRVKGVPEHARQALEQEGVAMGTQLNVERRVGMGGPIIVRLGRARLAISRATAGGVEVEPVGAGDLGGLS